MLCYKVCVILMDAIYDKIPSVYLFAVQADHCPGTSCGLCHCSAGGPCPAVPAGQRNSQAAFLNSVPTATAAVTYQTVKGERLELDFGTEKPSCCEQHKATQTVIAYSAVHSSSPPVPLINQLCFCNFINGFSILFSL